MGETKLQVEAIMTVPPLNVTEPRQVRQVLASDAATKAIAGCYHIVLYFNKSTSNNQEFMAGWVVESLARALSEHPLVAGRLRRRGDNDGDGGLEIVSNDSGVRMVEARIRMSMSQFLGLNRKDSVEVEADLVFWKAVDQHTPDFSPLFYVQVTSFECGGYSIGISCSLLLADFPIVENFLKKWSAIHNTNNMKSQTEETETITPIFYRPRLTHSESPPTDIITRTPTRNQVLSLIFKVTSQDLGFNDKLWEELGMICVEKAEQKLERNIMRESFWLWVRESGEVVRVGSCYKRSGETRSSRLKDEIVWTTWDEFGEYEVEFEKGNKAVLVSRWIGSVSDDEAHVLVVPNPREGVVSAVIIVSLPLGNTSA